MRARAHDTKENERRTRARTRIGHKQFAMLYVVKVWDLMAGTS